MREPSSVSQARQLPPREAFKVDLRKQKKINQKFFNMQPYFVLLLKVTQSLPLGEGVTPYGVTDEGKNGLRQPKSNHNLHFRNKVSPIGLTFKQKI